MRRIILLIFAMMIAIGAGKAIADSLTIYGILPPTAGGTGVANATTSTLTLGGALTTTGAGSQTFAMPASPFTYTFQASSDTIVGRATTDTLTNKTFDTAGTGNVFKINGQTVSSNTGSGTVNVLQTSPSLLGTVTGPDSGTWTSGGLNSIAKVGIGMTPTNVLDITQNQNAASTIQLTNNNNGTGVFSQVVLSNGTHVADIGIFGTGFTTSGMNRQDGAFLLSSGAGGLTISTSASQPIYFGINSVEALRIDANRHQVTSGPTPTCGAGCSSIAGNDNAFVVTTGAAQTSIAVNFGAAWGANPVCNISSNSTASVTDIASVSTAAITFGASVALSGALLYVNCRQ